MPKVHAHLSAFSEPPLTVQPERGSGSVVASSSSWAITEIMPSTPALPFGLIVWAAHPERHRLALPTNEYRTWPHEIESLRVTGQLGFGSYVWFFDDEFAVRPPSDLQLERLGLPNISIRNSRAIDVSEEMYRVTDASEPTQIARIAANCAKRPIANTPLSPAQTPRCSS